LCTEILKEVEGLGTEATRSGIIETIKRHGYIEVTKNIVTITNKGRILCEAIEGNLLASPSMTAKWEAYLRKIGNGEGTPTHFLAGISKFIYKLLDDVPIQLKTRSYSASTTTITAKTRPEGIATCPTCKQGMIVARKDFYGCTAYASGCKQTFPAIFLKKRLTPKQVNDLCTNGKTALLKGFISNSGKKFDAKLLLVDGKLKFEF